VIRRSKFTRVAVVVGTVFMLGMLSAAPNALNSSVAAQQPYEMVVGVAQKADTLNVFAMTLSISYTINFLVYDTLNSVEPDLTAGPQLAQSWETSMDGKLWTFHLAEDAVWHDGEPVTAADVAFTLNLVRNNTDDATALWVDYLSDVVRVEATGTYTVEIETSVPKATMLTMMVPILPAHVWSAIPAGEVDSVDPWNETYFPNGPVGSGPLKLVSWDSTKGEIRMLKNDDYFLRVGGVRQVVKVDEVLFKTFGSASVMVSALWSGGIDVAIDVPAYVWDDTISRPSLGGQVTSALSFYELGINCASPEWRTEFPTASDNLETTNRSVRQAIAMVTDKEYMVDTIFQGLAEEGESIIPTATPFWHYNVPAEDVWNYDIAGANALLDACGYVDADMDGTRENTTSGVELDFTLYYRKDYPDEENCAYSLRDSLDQVGIGVQLMPVSEGMLWLTWMKCEYDLFIWGWDTDVDPNFMLSTFTEAQYPVDQHDMTKWGDSFWINETYEELYILQQRAVDLNERQAIVHEMQRLLYFECPYVVLYYPKGLHAYNTDDWENFPDMVTYPGTTPGTMWFFFSVTPTGYVGTYPPEDVYAGPDQSCVVGEKLPFQGSAVDHDDAQEDLEWAWTFAEPDQTFGVRYGMNVDYTFNNTGNVIVTLIVTDPDGQSGSDSLVVNVTEMSATAGWIRGYVHDQYSNPVAGALVNVSGALRTTYSDGMYSLTLEEGEYSVLVSKRGYISTSETHTVVAGMVTWANFTIEITIGVLKGHVLDSESDQPIHGATVTVSLGSAVLHTFSTNEQGYYEFNEVQKGEVNVTITKSGYVDNVTTVIIVAGQTTTHDVELAPQETDGGLSTLALVAIAAVALVALALVAVYLMRKRKGGAEEETPPPPQ
jgi:peptide/nickel transport system substrate-binding protein